MSDEVHGLANDIYRTVSRISDRDTFHAESEGSMREDQTCVALRAYRIKRQPHHRAGLGMPNVQVALPIRRPPIGPRQFAEPDNMLGALMPFETRLAPQGLTRTPKFPSRGSGQIQPMPIKSLEGGTTSRNPLNDANTVQHRAGRPVPLGKHQHIAWPKGLDDPFKLWPLHALAARFLGTHVCNLPP